MKKSKINAVDSYASYKLKKMKWLMTSIILGIGAVVLSIAFFSGRFEKDKNSFLLANNMSLLSLGRLKPSEDIVLCKGSVSYELYTAPEETKGIYIPGKRIEDIDAYIKMAKETQVNSFVMDVKDDYGYLTFASDNEKLKAAGSIKDNPPVKDIDSVIRKLNEAGIYPIARIVAFKDNVYTAKHPDSAVKQKNGEVYVTSAGDRWLDPYNKQNWAYIAEVCDEAYARGFKEIQFDYVRFHESMNKDTAAFEGDCPKTEIITEFIQYMSEYLHKKNLKVSADVFGAVILSDLDASIVGQDFTAMSQSLDYISPMVYPSHYAEGTFGIDYPHTEPYEMILRTLKLGQKKIDEGGEKMAKIRPWLQDFTLSKEPYFKYGPQQLKDQIKGTYDAGSRDWLFWNAAGNYTKEGLIAQ